MPLIEYISSSGEVIELLVQHPVPETVTINGTKYRRRLSRFNVNGQAKPPSAADDIIKFYYQKELQEGARFRSACTKDEIKKAWIETPTQPYLDKL